MSWPSILSTLTQIRWDAGIGQCRPRDLALMATATALLLPLAG